MTALLALPFVGGAFTRTMSGSASMTSSAGELGMTLIVLVFIKDEVRGVMDLKDNDLD